MAIFEVPRPDLVASLAAGVPGRVQLLAGPLGAGKSFLLRALRDHLSALGSLPILVDLFGAASSPERLVTAMLGALPAGPLASALPAATRLRVLAESGRAHGAEALRLLFELLASLEEAGGRPAVLLLDEPTEIRSLAYFQGLRNVHEPFREMLEKRRAGSVLATSYPTQARKLWPGIPARTLPSLSTEELAAVLPPPARHQAEAFRRVGAGLPRYLQILYPAVASGDRTAEATFVDAMGPGGPLELTCRQTFETLLLRSRGYGMAKAVLATVAREEGLNLTPLVARLGRTPGATRDYLQWLVDVDALCREGKRYFFVDPVLRAWTRLYATGTLPSPAAVGAIAAELASGSVPASPAPAPRPSGEAESPGEEVSPRSFPRTDPLMEID